MEVTSTTLGEALIAPARCGSAAHPRHPCLAFQQCFVLGLFLWFSGCASIPARQPHANQKQPGSLAAVMWRDPGDVGSLNLTYGAGGREHAPDPKGTFTFIKEDLEATNPKFEVKDERGVQWKVKLGAEPASESEPQSETAATRFLWAAGYLVDEDYYLAEFKLTGAPKLRRGQNFITKDGTVHGARLERKVPHLEKRSTWDWFNNPFIGTREFNGLRTMIAFLNDWDLKADNNSVYEIAGERRYVVSDVGATFGRTGSHLSGTRNAPGDYSASTFISRTTPEFVDFEMRSRPFVLLAFDLPHYIQRSRMQAIAKHVPRADARWVGRRLAMLSPGQVRDGFRSAGYTPDQVDTLTQVVLKRIAALDAL